MEMSEVLMQITDKLGIASTEVYKVYVEAQATIGLLSVVSMLCLFIIMYCGIKYIYNKLKTIEFNEDGAFEAVFIISVIVFFALVCAASSVIEYSTLRMLCPEYTAIEQLISTLR